MKRCIKAFPAVLLFLTAGCAEVKIPVSVSVPDPAEPSSSPEAAPSPEPGRREG